MILFPKKSSAISREWMEDSLKHLPDCDESGRGATVESLAGALPHSRKQAAEILGQLRGRGLAAAAGDVHHLTEDGRLYALQVVRTHRLYETWLARKTGTPAADWHREAHKVEHHLQAAEVDSMADSLNNPRFDPHGDPIPTREGRMPKRALTSMASWPDGVAAHIAHIEDEPESLFRQAGALGFAPGTRIDESRHLHGTQSQPRVASAANHASCRALSQPDGRGPRPWLGNRRPQPCQGPRHSGHSLRRPFRRGHSRANPRNCRHGRSCGCSTTPPPAAGNARPAACARPNRGRPDDLFSPPAAVALRLLEGDSEIIQAVRSGEIGALAEPDGTPLTA